MTRSLASLWRWAAYAVFAILIFGVCVYITFPSYQFHAWLLTEADRRYGVRIVAQTLASDTPLRFEIDEATLSTDPVRVPSSPLATGTLYELPIEHLSAKLHAWPLLWGRAVLQIDMNTLGGVIRATLTAERGGGEWHYRVHGDSESLLLQLLEKHGLGLEEDDQVFTAGTVGMRFNLVWAGEQFRSDGGTVSVSMADTVVNITALPPVTISALSGDFTRDQSGWWRTDDLSITGDNDAFTATGQGRFLIDTPFSGSTINLALHVAMDATGKRQYPQLGMFMPPNGDPALLGVSGMLSRPVVLFNGVPILAP